MKRGRTKHGGDVEEEEEEVEEVEFAGVDRGAGVGVSVGGLRGGGHGWGRGRFEKGRKEVEDGETNGGFWIFRLRGGGLLIAQGWMGKRERIIGGEWGM